MENMKLEKDYRWIFINDENIKIKRIKKFTSLIEEKKKYIKGEILNDKILNLKFENENFMLGFFIWEIKPFKLLMKTYPEEERLKLKGLSSKKLQKFKNRDNKSIGGYFCIEEVDTMEKFESKLKFLLEYNQYIEIDFIRIYKYRFNGIKKAYQMLDEGKKKMNIIKELEKKLEEEKKSIVFLIYYLYLIILQKHINFERFLKI